MDTYSALRAFADSWGLALMFLVFLVIVVWVFRPGSKKIQDDTANVIFRHEDKPATDTDTTSKDKRDGR